MKIKFLSKTTSKTQKLGNMTIKIKKLYRKIKNTSCYGSKNITSKVIKAKQIRKKSEPRK